MEILPRFIRKSDISETAKANILAVICYFVSCLIISAIGIQYYWADPMDTTITKPIVFFLVLFIPWIIGARLVLNNLSSINMGRFLYILFLALYAFLIFTDQPDIMGLAIFPMMLTTLAYGSVGFTMHFNIGVVLVWGASTFTRYLIEDNTSKLIVRLFILAIMMVSVVFLILCTCMIIYFQTRKTMQINRERDRFQAIVSVGVEKIFEYDLKNDMIMIANSSGGVYGQEHYICNLSSVAKSQKYIPFADWYRFDELMVECRSGAMSIDKEVRLREENASDKEYYWYNILGRVIFDENGAPEKVIGTMKDIDQEKKLELRLADEKMRDSLTGLYKRPYINQFIDEYIQKIDKENDSAGFILVDLDDHSKIVEDMGEAFAEGVLKNISEDIKGLFDEDDLIGRIGGDEFVILMKETGEIKEIEKKVKDIQRIISDTYVGEGMRKKCTVSIGACLYPKDGEDYSQLFENSGKALDLAKSKGPNHYDIYSEVKESVYSVLADEIIARNARRIEAEQNKIYASESLIERAFKIMDESKDTDSAINLLIRQMIRQLGIDAIVIWERVNDETALRITHHCGFDEDMIADGNIIKYDDEQWNEFIRSIEKNDGILVNENIDAADVEVNKMFMLTYGIESYTGCAIYDKGNFAGIMDFIDFSRERHWTENELKDVRSLTKVVSSYMLKMKAYEKAVAMVERLAGFDSVTGLYKYERFLRLAGEYIANAEHGNYAVLYLDVFNFKFINDTFGYETGDMVLHELAQAVLSYSDHIVLASRVFSDNIVAIAKLGNMSEEEVKRGLDKAIESQTEIFAKRFTNSKLTIGMGVCTFTISGAPVMLKNIISNANMARKKSKQTGMPGVVFYDEQMGSEAQNEVAYSNDMEKAFENREFVVYFQPRVSLKDNIIRGAEALVRWKKPDGSIIYPDDFIPVFERNKSVTLLDFYVYEEVCRYLKDRIDKGLKTVAISVNVSRVHLYSIDEFITKIKGLLMKYNIPPDYLEFELTETSFTDKVDDSINLMSRLRKLGVKVSLDDFGSGYSSLNVLTKLPLDILKIDREFLRDLDSDSEEKIVIPSVIDMANKLKLEVVCEGVETIEHVKFLRSIGCEYAQGYYYSKPIPQSDFDELVEKGFDM